MDDLPHWALWLLAALVLLGAEAVTLQFVLVYFGLGALVAAAVSSFAGTGRPGHRVRRQRRRADGRDAAAARGLVAEAARGRHERRHGRRPQRDRHHRRSTTTPTRARSASDRSTGRRARPATTIRRSRRAPSSSIESVAGVTARVVRREPGVVIPKELQ